VTRGDPHLRNQSLSEAFRDLSTPLIADACVRQSLALRLAPPDLGPLVPGSRLAGRVLPVRHYGSVDVFLEAMERAAQGDILVIDNAGRADEGCIGDLTVLEARAAGLAGLIVWGRHRDTAEVVAIGLPVFSCGRCPVGPIRLDRREEEAFTSARVGACQVGRDDYVFADDDGVLFVEAAQIESVLQIARAIAQTERRQAATVREGRTLRDQFQFRTFLERRGKDPAYTFRKHLRSLGGAIEE
jgi:4-hydroxy-4-methyl-2-oxoglutarate aldolase